jgi:uncharacterized protein YprB with RNaseH-like and TPR domain
LQGLDGYDAVKMWQSWYHHGNEAALAKLLRYNAADTVNLAALAEVIYSRLVAAEVNGGNGHDGDGQVNNG